MMAAPAVRAEVADASIRAAILLNIVRFVDLPANGPGPLLLCVDQDSGAARAIAALDGERVGSRSVAHRAFDGDSPPGCDVIYVRGGSPATVARYQRAGVLLIGEGAGFARSGGTIGLIGSGTQIRFEANTGAARKAQIKLSSKLLRLAARVW